MKPWSKCWLGLLECKGYPLVPDLKFHLVPVLISSSYTLHYCYTSTSSASDWPYIHNSNLISQALVCNFVVHLLSLLALAVDVLCHYGCYSHSQMPLQQTRAKIMCNQIRLLKGSSSQSDDLLMRAATKLTYIITHMHTHAPGWLNWGRIVCVHETTCTKMH